jgi:uncharacterized membrane protein
MKIKIIFLSSKMKLTCQLIKAFMIVWIIFIFIKSSHLSNQIKLKS